MEKVAWITLLYDFYGQMLTEKQQHFFELYYEDDLSLGEIAEKFDVSRQAVHDSLKRAEQMLVKYEEKLGLVKKFIEQRDKIVDAKILLDKFLKDRDDAKIEQVGRILSNIMEIVKK
nr:putative DNA-binding protein [Desulfolucanica intricata]